MQYCEFCGSELPIHAHFCGNCGHLLDERTQTATAITDPSQQGLPTPDTPPQFSSPSRPIIVNAQTGQEDTDVTVRHNWAEWEMTQNPPHSLERNIEERRAILPYVLLPGMLVEQGQMPPAGQVPMVQETPQVGGVPAVQGTPPTPGAPTGAQSLAHGAASSAPPHAPTWEPQASPHQPVHQPHPAQPLHHQSVHYQQPAQPPYHQPVQHPQPTSPLHEPEHHHHHHHTAPLHARRPDAPRLHGSATGAAAKVGVGTSSKWLIVALVAVFVAATSGVALVLARQPDLSLSGNSTVASGQMLHLHGTGFLPGGSVTLTLDNGLPVSFAGQHEKQSHPQQVARNASFIGTALVLFAGQLLPQAASNTDISVSATGSFDASVVVLDSWSPGGHTIHATESLGSRSASLRFTKLSNPAKLAVNPSSLDFALQMGTKGVLSVIVADTGQSRLTWSAGIDAGGTNWLKIQGNSSGEIGYKSSNEVINLLADATHLNAGIYTTTLTIHSNVGEAQVPVTLKVVPNNGKKQAQLNSTPQSLDFGQIPANQQALQPISIGNLGQLPLTWQASTDAVSASWLTLDTSSGAVQPGTTPQTIQVIVSTTGLTAGNYTGTIHITSNGGTAQVSVTLTVPATQPGSPTPPHTPPPPPLIGSPNGFSVPGDPNCTYSSRVGWTCTATLSTSASAQSNLNWTASSTGVSGVTFSPPGATLFPGQPVTVTISIPNTTCPASANFTFNGPVNQVLMPWSCAAPTLSVSKSGFNANTDCLFSNGWTCTESLSTASNTQGNLSWSASSSGINGISFSPASGILSPGQPVSVTITVPSTTCSANANLAFSAQGATPITVPWRCSPASVRISPSSYTIPDKNCSYTSGQGWTCTATLSLANPGDPSTSWSTFGSIGGCCTVQYSLSSGILSPGQPTSITITISDTGCPAKLTLSFLIAGAKTVSVPWNCSPPALNAGPPGVSNCPQNTDGSWTCSVSLSIPQGSQGGLNWNASASSNLPGVTFTPQSGTLSSANSAVNVSINVPNNDCTSGTFTFSATGGNSVNVSWVCTPTLTVNPTSLSDLSGSPCTFDSTTNTWSCTVTLTETSNSQGNLNWSASSSLSGVTFSPPSGTLSSGQSAQVTISHIPCVRSGTFIFSGGAKPVSVSWGCGS